MEPDELKPLVCGTCFTVFDTENSWRLHSTTCTIQTRTSSEEPAPRQEQGACSGGLQLQHNSEEHAVQGQWDELQPESSEDAQLQSEGEACRESKPFVCGVCQAMFTDEVQLLEHKLGHGSSVYGDSALDGKNTPGLQENLDEANRNYGSIDDVKTNLNIEDSMYFNTDKEENFSAIVSEHGTFNTTGLKKLYQCDLCSKVFPHHCSLTRHVLSHSGARPYQCDLCHKTFRQRSHLKSHMLTHSQEKRYKCAVCVQSFTFKSSLTKHWRKRHDGIVKNDTEIIDSETFSSGNGIVNNRSEIVTNLNETLNVNRRISHRRISQEDFKQHPCTKCFQLFRTEQSLRRHYTLVHGPVKRQLPHKSCKVVRNMKYGGKVHKCDVCERVLSSRMKLVIHKRIHSGEKPVECSECGRCFRQVAHLTSHMITHNRHVTSSHVCHMCSAHFTLKTSLVKHLRRRHGVKPYACGLCEETFDYGSQLREHTRLHKSNKLKLSPIDSDSVTRQNNVIADVSDIKTKLDASSVNLSIEAATPGNANAGFHERNIGEFKCTKCEKNFSQKYQLADHMQRHIEQPYQCTQCSKSFPEEIFLLEHFNKHNIDKPHGCSQCSARFVKKSALLKHMQKHRGERNLKCEQCTKVFLSKSQLDAHVLTHKKRRAHACEYCTKSFIQITQYKTHLRLQHNVKPYQCTQCERAYNFKESLTCHMKEHNNDRHHQCDQCGKSFSSTSSLKYHLRTHSGEKPFLCQHCNKSFSSKGQLDKHVLTHGGSRSHACELCGKTFLLKHGLTRHRQTHKGEKNYQCSYCGKAFMIERYLKQHVVIHTGQKPHKCNICGESFAFSSTLSAHKQKHPEAVRQKRNFVRNNVYDNLLSEMSSDNMPSDNMPSDNMPSDNMPSDNMQVVQSAGTVLLQSNGMTNGGFSALNTSENADKLEHLLYSTAGDDLGAKSPQRTKDNHLLAQSGESVLNIAGANTSLNSQLLHQSGLLAYGITPDAQNTFSYGLLRYSSQEIQNTTNALAADSSQERNLSNTLHTQVTSAYTSDLVNEPTNSAVNASYLTDHIQNKPEENRSPKDAVNAVADAVNVSSAVNKIPLVEGVVSAPDDTNVSKDKPQSEGTEEQVHCNNGDLDDAFDDNDYTSEDTFELNDSFVDSPKINQHQTKFKLEAEMLEESPDVQGGTQIQMESSKRTKKTGKVGNLNTAGRSKRQKGSDSQNSPPGGTRGTNHQCTECGKTFPHKSALEKHLRVHNDERPYQCNLCEKTFRQSAHLKDHLVSHSGVKSQNCDLCGKEFTLRSSLVKHLRKQHDVEPVKCDACKTVFGSEENLEGHSKRCCGDVVDKTFEGIDGSNGGFKGGTNSLQCSKCGETFETKNDLLAHTIVHKTEKTHKCTDCDKTFALKSSLIKHERSQHGSKPYECGWCHLMFSFKDSLRSHVKEHNSSVDTPDMVKPHQCDQCGRSFTQKANMIEHMWTHSEVTPYKCETCSKCFGSRHRLERHLASHKGVKSFKCDQCEKSFVLKQGLKRHLLTHGSEKNHVCTYCGKAFLTERYLVQHEVVHTGARPHKCGTCGEAFAFSSTLSAHRQKHCPGKN